MIARVVINSPLPQLDRLFDYEIPVDQTAAVLPGVRVLVPFGRSKTPLEAFVVELVESSDFSGKLSQLSAVVSPARVLDSDVFELARAVADRQAATVSDVLRLAIPDRSVAVEKRWLENLNLSVAQSNPVKPTKPTKPKALKQTAIVAPYSTPAGPTWALQILDYAHLAITSGQSLIVVVPDFRDQATVLEVLKSAGVAEQLIDYSSAVQKSKRYENFLRCLSQEVSIVVGSRAAVYAPVKNLGQIIIWDDGDQSHQEPSSPYSHSREVALMRQRIQGTDLIILGHSRSTEVQRLVSMKFLEDVTKQFAIPRVANSESELRVDSMAWRAIRSGLESGAVLVQVGAKGNSSSIYCTECDTRANCKSCNGPLWVDQRNYMKCRWCNSVNLDFKCRVCNTSKVRQGSPGTTRTVAEFGRAFPGVQVIEATGDNAKIKLAAGKFIVVATPGAEPRVDGGYSSVVILDANMALNRDSLRASEDAIRQWCNAIALAKAEAQNVLVGVQGKLATKFSLWAQSEIAVHELANRVELRFPPAVRMASVGVSQSLIEDVSAGLAGIAGIEILGPIPMSQQGVKDEWRFLVKYEYSAGAKVAESLKALSLKLSAGHQRISAKSGRAMRPIRVKMDDVEVI